MQLAAVSAAPVAQGKQYLYSHPLRTSDLPPRKATRFALIPDARALAELAADIGASSLRKVSFRGELRPAGHGDWLLDATLEGTAVQPCVVTLTPVTTRIVETVRRSYLSDWQPPDDAEAEMPEDDTQEPLPAVIDPGAVMAEALALALPLYPRSGSAELGEAVFAEPGVSPLTEERLRPFAGLAGLRKRMDDTDPS